MIRYPLLLVALTTGIYAVAMWICGMLTDAGVAAATSAAAVLMAEFAAYCQRRRWRAGREQVWARRESGSPSPSGYTHLTFGFPHRPTPAELEPIERQVRAIWDFENGAPE